MTLNLSSPRQRALSRQALATLILACLLALACQLLPAARSGATGGGDAAAVSGAPPEAATRPNPPTEPIRVAEDAEPSA